MSSGRVAECVAALHEAFPKESQQTLERFAVARKGKFSAARAMYGAHVVWRSTNLPVDPNDAGVGAEMATQKFYALDGLAADGSAVVVFHGPRHTSPTVSPEGVLPMIVHVMQGALQRAEKLSLVMYVGDASASVLQG